MAKAVLIDELHVSLFVPRGLPEEEDAAATRTLKGKRFLAALRQAVLKVVRGHAALAKVQVTISR